MTQKTVLNDQHRQLGARMVDFGGWDMPLHYGSQIEEHHAVRQDCGMFDVSHMCAADLSGSEAKAFLLRLLANNVDKLKTPGRALYSAMLNETGGVIDDLIVYRTGDSEFLVVANASNREAVADALRDRLAGYEAEFDDASLRTALIAIQSFPFLSSSLIASIRARSFSCRLAAVPSSRLKPALPLNSCWLERRRSTSTAARRLYITPVK